MYNETKFVFDANDPKYRGLTIFSKQREIDRDLRHVRPVNRSQPGSSNPNTSPLPSNAADKVKGHVTTSNPSAPKKVRITSHFKYHIPKEMIVSFLFYAESVGLAIVAKDTLMTVQEMRLNEFVSELEAFRKFCDGKVIMDNVVLKHPDSFRASIVEYYLEVNPPLISLDDE